MSDEKTLGEIYYDGYWDTAPNVIHTRWAALGDGEREAIEAGAQDVARAAIQRRIEELDASEDAPGSTIGASGIDRLCKVAEGFEACHREYAYAAKTNAADHDFARAQTAIGASYRKCAEQLRDVIGDLASPTAEDFDRAAEELATRYALVEQMGFRHVTGTVRETTFLGEPVLEVTELGTGQVRLVSGKALYQVTWYTRDQAERATRTGAHSVAAIAGPPSGAGVGWGDGDSWNERDDVDRRANGESDDDTGDEL